MGNLRAALQHVFLLIELLHLEDTAGDVDNFIVIGCWVLEVVSESSQNAANKGKVIWCYEETTSRWIHL